MIFITGHDKDSSQVFSDSLTGNFTRLIAPGIWTFRVTAQGYYTATITNVSVIDRVPTILVVRLVPIINSSDTISTPIIKIYPDPANEFIRIIFPDRQIGKVNIRIFDSLGRIVADYLDFAYEDTPLVYSVSGLASGCYTVIIINDSSGFVDKGRFVVARHF